MISAAERGARRIRLSAPTQLACHLCPCRATNQGQLLRRTNSRAEIAKWKARVKSSHGEKGEVLDAARCNASPPVVVNRGQRIASTNQQLMYDAEPLEACHIKATHHRHPWL